MSKRLKNFFFMRRIPWKVLKADEDCVWGSWVFEIDVRGAVGGTM